MFEMKPWTCKRVKKAIEEGKTIGKIIKVLWRYHCMHRQLESEREICIEYLRDEES